MRTFVIEHSDSTYEVDADRWESVGDHVLFYRKDYLDEFGKPIPVALSAHPELVIDKAFAKALTGDGTDDEG